MNKQTPLYQEHLKLKATMVPFAGYSMPVQYESIKKEYESVRNNQGMFDISHMLPIFISHKNTKEIISYLQYLTCKDISTLKQGKVMYNALLSKDAGILDDITIYYLQDDLFALIVNASNAEKINSHLITYKKILNSSVEIQTLKKYVLIAVQGPNIETSVQKVFSKNNLLYQKIYYYENYIIKNKLHFPYLIAKTGYTGENGFEILVDEELGKTIWQDFIQEEVVPCGLASRDLLRLEMFYSLYGSELNEKFTPYESGLSWLVSMNKNFLGKQALQTKNTILTIQGFLLDELGVPRKGYQIFDADKKEIGEVTSGNFSFVWNKGFGLARIHKEYATNNHLIWIKIRNEYKQATLYKKSPYQGSIKRCPP